MTMGGPTCGQARRPLADCLGVTRGGPDGQSSADARSRPTNPWHDPEPRRGLRRRVPSGTVGHRGRGTLPTARAIPRPPRVDVSVPSDGDRRELRSDFLLVRPEGEDHYFEFRDVFEVDGRPVRDREERLSRLFLDRSGASSRQIQEITNESARYNIGSVERTLNTPTLALLLLDPRYQPTVTFSPDERNDTGVGPRPWRHPRLTECADGRIHRAGARHAGARPTKHPPPGGRSILDRRPAPVSSWQVNWLSMHLT